MGVGVQRVVDPIGGDTTFARALKLSFEDGIDSEC